MSFYISSPSSTWLSPKSYSLFSVFFFAQSDPLPHSLRGSRTARHHSLFRLAAHADWDERAGFDLACAVAVELVRESGHGVGGVHAGAGDSGADYWALC